MPSAASVPAPDATVKQAFEELQRRFDYDPKVTEKILELGVRSMSDFRFYPADAADAAASFVESITDLEGKRIQAARLKAAWSAVCKAEQARHDGAAPVELDEEELLPPQTLQGIKQAFFTRYKMHFPAEQFPGDRLITKLSRGLAKSNLEVFPILQVKTLGEQRVQVVKKRKVAPNLWYSSGQDDAEAEKSASKYLDLLYTYCLGLAIVGAEKPDNPPTEAETLSTSTLAYCKVPWDVVYRYHFRAADFMAKLGEHHPHRLQVLEKLDTAERTMWAAEFSKGGKTLGAVINEAYTTRDPLWLPEAHMRPAEPARAPPSNPGARSSGNQLATKLRDGKSLCGAWQQGKCPHQQEKACVNGEHLCARPLKSGRVCGHPGHTGNKCDHKQRAF